jgi:Omp85 superfamily domain
MRRMSAALLLVLAATTTARAQASADRSADDQSPGLFQSGRFDKILSHANRWFGPDDNAPGKSGFYPELANQITGSGWFSIGPGYQYRFLDGRALVDGSASLSLRGYEQAQARFELSDLASHRLIVGSQARYQDMKQIDYFGIGEGSSPDDRTEYRMQATDVVGYAVFQPNRLLAVNGTFGYLHQVTLSSPSGAFTRDFPSALDTFPSDPGMAQQPDYLHASVSVVSDTRDHAGYSRHGGVYRAAAAIYSDRDFSQYSFRQYEAEGLQYVPVIPNWVTLAFHGWGVFSDTSTGNNVPFYLLPALGGNNTIRGFHDYRFHDRNVLVASGEARLHVYRLIDLAGFFDAGNASAKAGDLNLNKTSWGGGVRLHTKTLTMCRFDVGHSVEGWQYFFRLNDSFRLTRLLRRTASTPYVP